MAEPEHSTSKNNTVSLLMVLVNAGEEVSHYVHLTLYLKKEKKTKKRNTIKEASYQKER